MCSLLPCRHRVLRLRRTAQCIPDLMTFSLHVRLAVPCRCNRLRRTVVQVLRLRIHGKAIFLRQCLQHRKHRCMRTKAHHHKRKVSCRLMVQLHGNGTTHSSITSNIPRDCLSYHKHLCRLLLHTYRQRHVLQCFLCIPRTLGHHRRHSHLRHVCLRCSPTMPLHHTHLGLMHVQRPMELLIPPCNHHHDQYPLACLALCLALFHP